MMNRFFIGIRKNRVLRFVHAPPYQIVSGHCYTVRDKSGKEQIFGRS
jgi:hypothetical protein